ncbi:MAG: pallilysin-related adhesin [Treponema sp.]|jgi:hypothetical protein|nr:pallilysin-related adhesin [Treponema sp.]
MNKKALFFTGIGVLCLCVLGILFLTLGPFSFLKAGRGREPRQTRLIIPQETRGGGQTSGGAAEKMAYEEGITVKAALGEGEILTAVLTQNFDGDPAEEQIVAYRNRQELEGAIYVSYIDYNEADRTYRRIWSAPTAAARPGTISLFTQDLIGDRSICVILTGMNGAGEHTMTIFRKNSRFQPFPPSNVPADMNQPFNKIAELRIDGAISIQETGRPQAYHLGIAQGQSFSITAYGHDYESSNIMDQREITYAFNPRIGLYEQSAVVRVPGSQIEQRRLRELLSGAPGVFEAFINDLWYYVSPEGTLDKRRYIYFDPPNRELIFFEDETQQVFTWQNASRTRYGLYISSQNISVTTLRRFLDIELQSLDSIRVKLFEDVRLKIGISASWDGSYRRAGSAQDTGRGAIAKVDSRIDALYDSPMGKIRFFPEGRYELRAGETVRQGKYSFFAVNGQELLELRPEQGSSFRPERGTETGGGREIYRVDAAPGDSGAGGARKSLSLSRVRLGTMGVQELHEGIISLNAAEG